MRDLLKIEQSLPEKLDISGENKMIDFENKFIKDDKFFKQYSYQWVEHRLFPIYTKIMMFLLFILGVSLLLFRTRTLAWYLAMVCIVVPIIIILRSVFAAQRMIKINQERSQILMQNVDVMQIEISGEDCTINGNLGKERKSIKMSLVEDHFESKNYFFVLIKGLILLPFSKEGFTKGNTEEFREYLKRFPKRVNKRAIFGTILLTIIFLAGVYVFVQTGM